MRKLQSLRSNKQKDGDLKHCSVCITGMHYGHFLKGKPICYACSIRSIEVWNELMRKELGPGIST